jgi:uncharacterized protein
VIDPTLAAYAALAILLAYVVRGIAGFGSGLIAVPLLSVMAPLQTVVPVVVSLDYVGSGSQSLRNRGRVAWRELLALLPFSLIGIGVGLLVLKSVSTAILSKSLGAFVIVYAVYQLLPLPRLRSSRVAAVPCGLVGGFVGALFGTGGPFYAIYFHLRGLEKTEFRATFATNFLIDGGVRLIGYAIAGLFGWSMLGWIVVSLPIMAIGLIVGGRIHLGLSPRGFVQLVSVILLASGVALLVR